MQSDRCTEAEFCVPANLYNFSTNLTLTYPRLEGKYLHVTRGEWSNLFQYCDIKRTTHKL